MAKRLVVAEKPSVARDLAAVLGCKERKEGCIDGAEYTVTWAVGHLVTLCDPGEVDAQWKPWRKDTLPMLPQVLPKKLIRGAKTQFDIIKKCMKSKDYDTVICATDAGREGELIFGLIYEMAKCTLPVQRLWISSMTAAAIRKGFDELRPGSEFLPLYQSAVCRSEADWLVGMNASRAYSLLYRARLSIGRVQTPTLAFLVRRADEIEQFVPKAYGVLWADFGDYRGFWVTADTANGRHEDIQKAQACAEKIMGKQGQIIDISEEEKRTPPPLLMDLTSLQREANRRYGFSAAKTLSIAQQLYEKHKTITYPRTDSRFITRDLIPSLKGRLAVLQGITVFAPHVAGLLSLEKLPITGRIVQDAKVRDHHAILPTERAPSSLTPDEAKIYGLVARAFVGVFMPEMIALHTTVTTQCQDENFITRGKRILQAGWQNIWADLDKNTKEKATENPEEEAEDTLPALSVGDIRIVKDTTLQSKQTQPPKPYTEASLLSAMEHAGKNFDDELLREQMKDCGLGTPATRAAIIERLIEVGYVTRQKKALLPTDKGRMLIRSLPEPITSAQTTGKWERALSRIATSQMQPQDFMDSIRRFCGFLVQDATTAKSGIAFPFEEAKLKRAYSQTAHSAAKSKSAKTPAPRTPRAKAK